MFEKYKKYNKKKYMITQKQIAITIKRTFESKSNRTKTNLHTTKDNPLTLFVSWNLRKTMNTPISMSG